MDSVSRTRSGRSFSSFDVFESSVDISTSLQQAFVGLSDVDSKDHDDSEGCPLDILDSDAPNYSVPLSPPVSTIFQRPTTSNLDEGAKHPSTRTASQQEYRRKKKQHTRQPRVSKKYGPGNIKRSNSPKSGHYSHYPPECGAVSEGKALDRVFLWLSSGSTFSSNIGHLERSGLP